MAYLKSHQSLADHPKTRRAARKLGVNVPTVIGHLHLLWWWAVDYTPDGDLTHVDADDLADAARWEGDPQRLLDALVDCGPGDRAGFLERDGDRLVIHDWLQADHAGALATARKALGGARGNHERWHVARGQTVPDCPWCVGNRSHSDSHSDRTPNPEKRREEKSTTARTRARGTPPAVDNSTGQRPHLRDADELAADIDAQVAHLVRSRGWDEDAARAVIAQQAGIA